MVESDREKNLRSSSRESSELPDLISQILGLVEDSGQEFADYAALLRDLHNRLIHGRFHLAVLGQFKRGKSTLLNALLGEAVLPTAVVPVTAIPTFISYGTEPRATIVFGNDRADETFAPSGNGDLNTYLSRFVAESENPKNRLGVSHVEITHPATILKEGVVLIDTPGIGSTLRHNTETTLNFLSQCDAALFLASADPPLTETEVEFLKQVREKVHRLFFLMNKVDYLDAEERSEALRFLEKVLADQTGAPEDSPILCISAKTGLKARRLNDPLLWRESGLEAVEDRLVEFLVREKRTALNEAIGRKTADVLADLLLRMRLALQSLRLPLQELEQRIEVFERKLDEVKGQRLAIADMLAGDCKRMLDHLQEHAGRLRDEGCEYLEGVIEQTAPCGDGRPIDEKRVRDAIVAAIPGYFEQRLGSTTDLFRERMTEVLRPHQDRVDRLIETIRRTAAELFDVPYRSPQSHRAFEMVRQPYWVTRQWSSTLSPIPPDLLEGLLPGKVRRRRVLKRVKREVDALVLSNVESLRWWTYQSINQAFVRFGSTLEERMKGTLIATHGAIRAAMERKREHGDRVSNQEARLEEAVAGLSRFKDALAIK